VSTSIRPGDVLAGRYRLEDLLDESRGARFWRAHDRVLARHVAVHVISADDDRAPGLLAAARSSATVPDRRFLRVLDADERGGLCFVVNEWGSGTSLDIVLCGETSLDPRHAAWITAEVAAAIAAAHELGVSHGRLVPENVLLDHNGAVRVIGLAVDAALHGLPPGRREADVIDLAGLLYAGLTDRWAGLSRSVVTPAPVEGGRVLRARKVRAGIPRSLDTLCVAVLDPSAVGSHARAAYDLSSARGIADYLRAFAGDPAGLAAQVTPPGGPGTGDTWVTREPESDDWRADPPPPPAPGQDGDDPGEDTADHGPATALTPVAELPTEAGMPIFDEDDDEVHWFAARSHKPAPPPPFEQPVERPLFAPEPPPGVPARTPRPGMPATIPAVWDDQGTGSSGSGSRAPGLSSTGSSGGTGSQEYWPWRFPHTGTGPMVAMDEGDGMPGRRWLRLAMIIAAATVLLLAIVVIATLGRDDSANDPAPSSPGTGNGTAAAGAPLTGLVATDFDPQGDPPEENPELAPAAVDGNPGTAWQTMTYQEDLGPGGLKTGVGLTVDLGSETDLSSAEVTFAGSPTTASVYLTDDLPRRLSGLTPAATDTVDERMDIAFEAETTGRYLTVWLTSLPPGDGGFRGGIAEVVVRG
jgi:hypothetical protein